MAIQNLGEKLFRAVAPSFDNKRSPGGETITGAEMRLGIAALKVDGYDKKDAALLEKTFRGKPLNAAARRAYGAATKILGTHSYTPRSWTTLTGKIENQTIFGIGGEAPPSGQYLMLDKEIEVGGVKTKQVYLGSDYPEGAKLELSGRLDLASYGGVEVTNGRYVALTGISNLTAGEPKFDGKKFVNAQGKTLDRLSLPYPELLADAPSEFFVVDQANDKAFIGSAGGFIPEFINPFHGFKGSASIDNATTADRAKVRVENGALFSVATGDALYPAGEAGRAKWFVDRTTNTVYRLANGSVDQKIALPPGRYSID